MSTERHNEEKIRALFEESHRSQPAPPAFRRLWPTAPSASPWRRLGPLRFALPAALAGALTLVVTVSTLRERPTAGDLSLMNGDGNLASTSWQGPLDFLLRTPGYDFLEVVPGPSSALGPDLDTFNESLKESLP